MRFSLLVVVALLIACRMEEPSGDKKGAAPEPPAAKPAAATTKEPIGDRGVRFVHADPGDVAELMKKQLADAKSKNRDVLVYEGAKWCQPCQKFHEAAAKGELDATFPALTLVEFDADVDGERLLNAGYGSRFIPLFALPGADGKAAGKQIEGSVKGDAIADLTPRLKTLLVR
jgi:hypothetical protein